MLQRNTARQGSKGMSRNRIPGGEGEDNGMRQRQAKAGGGVGKRWQEGGGTVCGMCVVCVKAGNGAKAGVCV